jgi:hypothetical protein
MKVDVIFVMVYFFEYDEGVMLCYLLELYIKVGKNSIIEDLFSVLGDNDYVVVTKVYTVGQMHKFHILLIVQKKRFRDNFIPRPYGRGSK